MNKSYPPSVFSVAGIPFCSSFGKVENEILAWAYVTGMSRDGDTWHKMTPEKCYELLDCEERQFTHPYLPRLYGRYVDVWKNLGLKLKDSGGAFDIGGVAWNNVQIVRIKGVP